MTKDTPQATTEQQLNVVMTIEQKRYLMGLLKKTLNHYSLHLTRMRGQYHQRDSIEYQAHLAHTIYNKLKSAETYKQVKSL